MPIILVAILLILAFPQSASTQAVPEGVLSFDAQSSPLAVGSNGVVRINFQVKRGFKIAKKPPPKLSLVDNAAYQVEPFEFGDSESDKDPGYFGKLKSLELKVAVAKSLNAGNQSIEGKLVYFFCSEQDKYCSRSIEKFVVPLKIIERK